MSVAARCSAVISFGTILYLRSLHSYRALGAIHIVSSLRHTLTSRWRGAGARGGYTFSLSCLFGVSPDSSDLYSISKDPKVDRD